jgi:ribosomal protein S17E
MYLTTRLKLLIVSQLYYVQDRDYETNKKFVASLAKFSGNDAIN